MENIQKKSAGANLFVLIFKHWKLLIIVAIATIVVSFACACLIPPQFKSTVILLPTSTNAVSQVVLAEGNYNEELDVTQFGDDMSVDRMVQILNSRYIKDHLIQKFDLIAYYDLDTTTKYWKTKLYKNMQGDIKCARNSYLGVEVSVANKNPQMAADMANEIANYYDTLKHQIITQRTHRAFEIVQAEMDSLEILIEKTSDSLSIVMAHGVYDYETQSERLYQQYAKEVAAGNQTAINRLDKELKTLQEWGPLSFSLKEQIVNLREYQQVLQSKKQMARVDMQYALSQKFVVEYAVPSDKKFYPKKIMIVLVSTISMLVLTLFFIVFQQSIIDTFHSVKTEE
ncbi:MAG: hypothetical protein J5725_10175 [Bacteroidales bacterium]|nr:hypothetical protein [Bacteroidales bacterium]